MECFCNFYLLSCLGRISQEKLLTLQFLNIIYNIRLTLLLFLLIFSWLSIDDYWVW